MQQSEIKQVQTGLEIYYVDNNSYPSSLDKLPNLLESSKSFQYQLQQNGTDYKLCTPLSMKKQECFTSKGTLKE
ncbi:MAG: type II secretion system protein GspG [Patescibacteria group bacterium]